MNSIIERAVRKATNAYIQYIYLLGKSNNCRPPENTDASCLFSAEGILTESFIAPVYKNRNGIVTIVSDDGDYQTGQIINLLSKKYHVPFTIGGTVLNIARHEAWWKHTLKNNSLMEIVNHSYNHVRMDSNSDISSNISRLTHEIIHSQKYFESRFGKKQICFVCPENMMCSEGYELLRHSGVLAVRLGARGYNDLCLFPGEEPGELFNLKMKGIMDSTITESGKMKWLEDASNENKWLIEMWHNICDHEDGGFQTILTADAEKHLKEIMELSDCGMLWPARMTDALKYILERQYFESVAVICGDKLLLSLSARSEGIDTAIFDHPLTVLVKDSGRNIIGADSYTIIDNSVWYMADVTPGTMRTLRLDQ